MIRKGLGKGLGMGYKNIAPLDSHIHSLSAKGVKSIYRARGYYKPTKRESYVTTVWRRNKEDAEQDVRVFTRYNDDWKDVRIVEEGYDEYLKKHQRLPRLNAKSKVNESNLLNYIIEYEAGELGDKATLDLFSFLIQSGKAWSLQGHYGRTAKALIESGWISPKGIINKSKVKENVLDARYSMKYYGTYEGARERAEQLNGDLSYPGKGQGFDISLKV